MKLLISIVPLKDDWHVVGSVGHVAAIVSKDSNINLEKVEQQKQIRNIIARYEEFVVGDEITTKTHLNVISNINKRINEEIEKFKNIL